MADTKVVLDLIDVVAKDFDTTLAFYRARSEARARAGRAVAVSRA